MIWELDVLEKKLLHVVITCDTTGADYLRWMESMLVHGRGVRLGVLAKD